MRSTDEAAVVGEVAVAEKTTRTDGHLNYDAVVLARQTKCVKGVVIAPMAVILAKDHPDTIAYLIDQLGDKYGCAICELTKDVARKYLWEENRHNGPAGVADISNIIDSGNWHSQTNFGIAIGQSGCRFALDGNYRLKGFIESNAETLFTPVFVNVAKQTIIDATDECLHKRNLYDKVCMQEGKIVSKFAVTSARLAFESSPAALPVEGKVRMVRASQYEARTSERGMKTAMSIVDEVLHDVMAAPGGFDARMVKTHAAFAPAIRAVHYVCRTWRGEERSDMLRKVEDFYMTMFGKSTERSTPWSLGANTVMCRRPDLAVEYNRHRLCRQVSYLLHGHLHCLPAPSAASVGRDHMLEMFPLPSEFEGLDDRILAKRQNLHRHRKTSKRRAEAGAVA